MKRVPAIDRTQMRRNFSQHAADYDRYARVQKRVAARVMELALENGFGDGMALDIGTGTGELARHFHRERPESPLLICDMAHGMTCAAAASLPSALPLDADAHQMPLQDGSLSLVLSSSVFQWVEDLSQVFRECGRVLRPGGGIAFALFGEQTLWQLHEAFRIAQERAGSHAPDHFQRFPSRDRVGQALTASGFEVIECFSQEECEYHPDLRQLLHGLKQIGAQNVSRERPRGLFPRKVMLEMTALYGEQFSDENGLPASYEVIYAVARRA